MSFNPANCPPDTQLVVSISEDYPPVLTNVAPPNLSLRVKLVRPLSGKHALEERWLIQAISDRDHGQSHYLMCSRGIGVHRWNFVLCRGVKERFEGFCKFIFLPTRSVELHELVDMSSGLVDSTFEFSRFSRGSFGYSQDGRSRWYELRASVPHCLIYMIFGFGYDYDMPLHLVGMPVPSVEIESLHLVEITEGKRICT